VAKVKGGLKDAAFGGERDMKRKKFTPPSKKGISVKDQGEPRNLPANGRRGEPGKQGKKETHRIRNTARTVEKKFAKTGGIIQCCKEGPMKGGVS